MLKLVVFTVTTMIYRADNYRAWDLASTVLKCVGYEMDIILLHPLESSMGMRVVLPEVCTVYI
jgi:hypothetical protein